MNVGGAKPAPMWLAVITVVLLTIGGVVVLPAIGWVAGIVMLWVVPGWTRGQRAIGSLSLVGSAAFVVATLLPALAPSLDPSSPFATWQAIAILYTVGLLIYAVIALFLLRAFHLNARASVATAR